MQSRWEVEKATLDASGWENEKKKKKSHLFVP